MLKSEETRTVTSCVGTGGQCPAPKYNAILNGAAAYAARGSGESLGSGSERNTSIHYLPKSCYGG